MTATKPNRQGSKIRTDRNGCDRRGWNLATYSNRQIHGKYVNG